MGRSTLIVVTHVVTNKLVGLCGGSHAWKVQKISFCDATVRGEPAADALPEQPCTDAVPGWPLNSI